MRDRKYATARKEKEKKREERRGKKGKERKERKEGRSGAKRFDSVLLGTRSSVRHLSPVAR